jgi:hypothetical protein
VAPQRNIPVTSNPGLEMSANRALNDIKGTTGIYDPSLGNRSNETSGVAINARERQTDVGNVVYIDNFMLAMRQVGRVLVDLIPKVYDTERQVQILGEDGAEATVTINKAMATDRLGDEAEEPIEVIDQNPAGDSDDIQDRGLSEPDEGEAIDEDADPTEAGDEGERENDVTVGAYSVIVDAGPSFTTKREEARTGFEAFLKAAPQLAPILLDLYAKAQDWPFAQEIADRIEATLPPPIKALLKREKLKKEGVPEEQLPPLDMGPDPNAPPPVPPEVIALKQAEAQAAIAEAVSKKSVAESKTEIGKLDIEIKTTRTRVEGSAGQGRPGAGRNYSGRARRGRQASRAVRRARRDNSGNEGARTAARNAGAAGCTGRRTRPATDRGRKCLSVLELHFARAAVRVRGFRGGAGRTLRSGDADTARRRQHRRFGEDRPERISGDVRGAHGLVGQRGERLRRGNTRRCGGQDDIHLRFRDYLDRIDGRGRRLADHHRHDFRHAHV